MNSTILKLLSLLTLAIVSIAAAAAPGTPIGGIVVKGGKNPGGHMAVLATTDSKGRFAMAFSEQGEYRIEFGIGAKTALREHPVGDFRLDYVVTPNGGSSESKRTEASRTTLLSSNFKNARLLVVVPNGGVEITGAFQSAETDQGPAADRAINEAGVSVKSSRPKGSAK